MIPSLLRAVIAASLCLWSSALGSEVGSDLLLVHDSTRQVANGQFAQFKVPATVAPEDMALRVQLDSLSGDADLYLGQHDETSILSFENYALKSTTYGVEVVEVPASFPRPLAIAVFADGPRLPAEFRLRVYLDRAKSLDEYERVRAASQAGAKTYDECVTAGASAREPAGGPGPKEPARPQGAKNARTPPPRLEEKSSSWLLTLLFHLLEVLVEVLL